MSQPVGFDPLSSVVGVGRYLALSLASKPLTAAQRSAFEQLGGSFGPDPNAAQAPGKARVARTVGTFPIWQGETITDKEVRRILRDTTVPAPRPDITEELPDITEEVEPTPPPIDRSPPGVTVPYEPPRPASSPTPEYQPAQPTQKYPDPGRLPEWAFTTLPNLDVPLPPVIAPQQLPGVFSRVLGRVLGPVGWILFPSETAPDDVPAAAPPQRTPPFVPAPPPFPDWEDFTREPWLVPMPPRTFPIPRGPYPWDHPLPELEQWPKPEVRPYPEAPPIPDTPLEVIEVEAPRPVEFPVSDPYSVPVGVPLPAPTPVRLPKPVPIPSTPTVPRWLTIPLLPIPWFSPGTNPDRVTLPEPGPEPYAPPGELPYSPPLPFAPPAPYAPPSQFPARPPQFELPRTPSLTPLRTPGIGYDPDPLSQYQPREADYDPCQKTKTRKRKKERKPREVCYSGTYVERKFGTNKSRKRKVPCR